MEDQLLLTVPVYVVGWLFFSNGINIKSCIVLYADHNKKIVTLPR